MDDSEHFEPSHVDRVTVLDTNSDGTRMLTGSIDHKLKVWKIEHNNHDKTLLETVAAHDAYLIAAKFTSPTVGAYIGTIGADLCFRLWTEDFNQAPNSGRRFRSIATIPSTPRVPFTSFDFRTQDQVYIYLALIDRQGLLSVYEPSDPDHLSEWSLLDQFHVCSPIPSRGEETSFRLCFDQNVTPLAYMTSLSDDDKQLGLLVSSLNDVKIYHAITDTDTSASNKNEHGPYERLTFHESFRLPTHPDLVRSIAWAPSNVRGVEYIATSCKDGTVRIFEIAVKPTSDTFAASTASAGHGRDKNITRNRPPQQSSLTSAITGRSSTNGAASTDRPTKSHVLPFVYHVEHVSTFSAHGDVWSLDWDRQGNTLLTGGNDGVMRLWRKSIPGGEWIVFAEHQVESDEE